MSCLKINTHAHTLCHTHNQAVLPALAFCFSSRPSAAYTMAKAQGKERAMNGAEKEREKGRKGVRGGERSSGDLAAAAVHCIFKCVN